MMTIQYEKTGRWKKSRAVPRTDIPFDGDALGAEVLEAFPPHPGRRMTEAEFMGWVKERTRAEWVNGEVILKSPVNLEHDNLQGWLYSLVRAFVEEFDLGRVCGGEFAVRLAHLPSFRLTDLSFMANGNGGQFEKSRFVGAPDLIVEIVSPDSGARDYRDKFNDYQAAGVREYWIVDPIGKMVEVNELVKGKYRHVGEIDGAMHSKVLKGFYIKPAWLWQKKLPKVRSALLQMGIK